MFCIVRFPLSKFLYRTEGGGGGVLEDVAQAVAGGRAVAVADGIDL